MLGLTDLSELFLEFFFRLKTQLSLNMFW
jgi:hypothetical protein